MGIVSNPDSFDFRMKQSHCLVHLQDQLYCPVFFLSFNLMPMRAFSLFSKPSKIQLFFFLVVAETQKR